MLAILSAPGSRGDVNPMIAIGAELRRRGFDVVISLAEPYVDVAKQAGLNCEAVIDRSTFESLLSRPEMWRPLSGARAIFREVVAKFLPLHYEVIRKHLRPGETVLVAHPLDFASRTHRDVDPMTPLASVHLAPSMLLDPVYPPRMSPWRWELRRPAWAVAAAFYLAEHIGLYPSILPSLHAFRRQLGLPLVTRPLKSWWLSPDRLVLMYPQWYAPLSSLRDERFVYAGFPLADHDDAPPPLELESPIVFTGGTANHHAKEFFNRAIEACAQLGHNGVLLTSHPANVPPNLPANIQALGYVSLAGLLRQSRAIVHHGGIGTTSQALAAGVPQLICPLAYDQFDNASRVETLGAGRWLRDSRKLAPELQSLLADTSTQTACNICAERLTGVNGPSHAADAIEQLLRHGPSST